MNDTGQQQPDWTPGELEQLISQLCDEIISPADYDRLAEILGESAEARRIYVNAMQLHADLFLHVEHDVLRELLAESAEEDLEIAGPTPAPKAAPAPGLPPRLVWPAMAATALFAVLGWSWAASLSRQRSASNRLPPASQHDPSQGQSQQPLTSATDDLGTSPVAVGHTIAASTTRWSDEWLRPGAAGAMATGRYALTRGTAEIQMHSGATLRLTAPASFSLHDAKAIELHHGTIEADVPRDAVGFHVSTPSGDLVDLGTEFALSVDDDGSTEIHVHRGVVVARSFLDDGVVPIFHDEAGRIDAMVGSITPVSYRAPPPAADQVVQPEMPTEAPVPPGSRIVFVGDNNVADEWHLLFLAEALRPLPQADRPDLFNAGIAFPFWFDDEDYQRYITRFRPTHVVIEFNSELALRSHPTLTPQMHSENLRRMIDRFEADGIVPILSTGYSLDPLPGEKRVRGRRFNQTMRELATAGDYRLADIETELEYAALGGTGVLRQRPHQPGLEPTVDGHRHMAIALLRALGYDELEVPERLSPDPLPGVITDWKVRYRPEDADLMTAAQMEAMDRERGWQSLQLPQPLDRFAKRQVRPWTSKNWVNRQRGFATLLYGDGKTSQPTAGVIGIASIESDGDREAWLNGGGGLRQAWINGELVLSPGKWRGGHAGSVRLPIHLKEGINELVIETGNTFFVSVTDEFDWSL